MEVRQGHFRGGDEVQVAVGDPCAEEVRFELRQLAGASHGLPADDRRHRELGVTVPFGVQVQQEVRYRPLQAGACPAGHGEPRPGELGGPREVEDAEPFPDGHVVGRFELEHRLGAPGSDQLGILVRVAFRQVVGGQVRHLEQERLQLGGSAGGVSPPAPGRASSPTVRARAP